MTGVKGIAAVFIGLGLWTLWDLYVIWRDSQKED